MSERVLRCPQVSRENHANWKGPKGSDEFIRVLRDLNELEGYNGMQRGPQVSGENHANWKDPKGSDSIQRDPKGS